MIRNFPHRRAGAVSAALLMVLVFAACGGGSERAAPGSAAETQKKADLERRIAEMEGQLAHLKTQSQGLRRELEARLAHLDAAHDALGAQVEGLRSELLGRRSALPFPGEPVSAAPPVAASAPPPPERSADAGGTAQSSWILRLILFIVIAAAIGFIASIFLGRWGAPEEVASERAEDSGVTDLGKIRAMGGAPPAAPESAGPADPHAAPLPFADDPEEQ